MKRAGFFASCGLIAALTACGASEGGGTPAGTPSGGASSGGTGSAGNAGAQPTSAGRGSDGDGTSLDDYPQGERLQQADAAAAAARTPQPIQVNLGYLEADPRAHRQPLDSDAELDDPADGEPDATEFMRAVQRRHSGIVASLPRDLNRLLLLLEAKVDDLAELEGSELRDAAVDLAILASCIDPASRRKG